MATQPRLIRPGATYAICRRVEGRWFLLRPGPKFNALFAWLLAFMAERFSVQVHVAVCMSTHFHLVVTVPLGNVSDFMHGVNLNLSRAMRVLRRFRWGTVLWEPGRLSIVELVTEASVVQQIAYALVNPVTAGLVFAHGDWPGVTQRVEELGVGLIGGKKPSFFFRSRKWRDCRVPLVLPDFLAARGLEEAHAILREEVAHQEQLRRAEVKAKGWRVLGAVRAKAVSPYERAKSWESQGSMAPRIAAGRGEHTAREAALEELAVFLQRHAEAKERWCAGEREVVFPAGTYWMRVHHGARVEPWPD